MKWLIGCLGLLLILAGSAAVLVGWDIVTLERGWTLVISGSGAVTGGVVTLALALVAASVDALARLMVPMPETRILPDDNQTVMPLAEPQPLVHAPAPVPVVPAEAAPLADEPAAEAPALVAEALEAAPPRRPRLPMPRPPFGRKEAPVERPAEPEPSPPLVLDEGEPQRPPLSFRRAPPVPRKPYRPLQSSTEPARVFGFADSVPPATEPVAEPPFVAAPEEEPDLRSIVGAAEAPSVAVTPEPLVPTLSPAYQRAEWPSSPERQAAVIELPRIEPAFVAAAEPAPAIEALTPPGRHDWLERALAGLDDPPEPAAATEAPPPVHLEEPPHEEAPPLDPVEPIASAQSSLEIGRYESNGSQYVMFADGSIEADTPRGVYRFASMDDLKAFIDEEG